MAGTKERIVVIGSGPCGLGAAYRLQELGHEDFLVLEAGPEAGGLSITATDENGFLFDMGASCVRGVFVWVCGWAGGRAIFLSVASFEGRRRLQPDRQASDTRITSVTTPKITTRQADT